MYAIRSYYELAVITTISYDHTDILGKTLPEIAYEKAGIIKQGGDVILYEQSTEVEQVFENRITSYNVCYTKLLRILFMKLKYWKKNMQKSDVKVFFKLIIHTEKTSDT